MRKALVTFLSAFALVASSLGQNAAPVQAPVPNLINYSGVLNSAHGSITGVTFLLYRDQQGGAPLWVETQNVALDTTGHYNVHLGSASNGLPADLFQSGEARWLAVQVAGEAEQPRVLLVAVPYAMKAADAATVGGLPPSAFVLAAPPAGAGNAESTVNTSSNTLPANVLSPSLSGAGTTDYLPLWTSSTALGSSALFQTGSGSTTKIGINTTTPAAMLDVKGSVTIRSLLNLPATTNATASAGANSNQIGFVASSFNSSTNSAANQVFRWQAEPVGNDTSSPSATLNMLFGTAPNTPTETGLKINNKGQITFSSGQTFPGTITGITAGTDLTGGGTSGNVTLNLNTANVPQLNSANAFSQLNIFPSVGIGTSSPLANLDVMGSGLNILLGDPGCGTFAAIGFQNQALSGCTNYALLGDASGGTYLNASGSSGTIHFRVNNNDEVMDIESNKILVSGQVGIGTSSPAAVLDVETAGAGIAGYFQSDSDNQSNPTLLAINSAPSEDAFAYAFGAGGSWNFGNANACGIDQNGNLTCSGSKSAVVPVDGGSRKVALYAVEAPENWFEDYGSGQLSNGSARIDLEPTFAQTVNTALEYHVFLTPNGDCKGLYVSQKSPTSFEVHELGGGTSSIAFDYRVIAKRKNYENIRLADYTERDRKLSEQIAAMRQRKQARPPAALNTASALQQRSASKAGKEK